ncbi:MULTISPECIES: toxin co-regulated pilus biosynthesis Q family protein [unclassified Cupriavidus]|uniref:toxin co-regulated pilus biosynthesis Q family protein n=1 Tax=unclassified Cupriavidus TaxID=2640874 RepID=UPI001AE42C21|nr:MULTISPECIES: toxin co-regulated pilus biosynthesis Q family protein [unclassified Cupriavidus]MBP0633134.1 toxin co-regulated pilus biosynthesis Q family protein [Cupriavidus sp. AcVe19-1a]MBP0639774.1 toxin co-regulated pilus biosynthesis Q family protein [Cupriavidus sp. AcVe19-6a]
MCQSNRTVRFVVAAASLVSGLILLPAVHASHLSNDGWQQLQAPHGAKAAKAAGSPTLLAANTPSAGAAPSMASTPAVPITAPAAGAVFRLVKGEALQQQLQNWASRAGWTVAWNVPDGWIVPGDKDYGSDFESAVKRVVEELANNGADVVGDSWRGNRTVIISQNGMVQ